MPDIPNTTRAQTIFLRAFRTNPGGPPPSLWPTPAILRKWLRRPGFLRALNSILDTLRFQSDFHLANAATHASAQLLAPPNESPDNPPPDLASFKPLESILRLAHLRQRFAAIESRHSTTQTLTGELAQAQSQLADLRTQLAVAEQKLKLSVPLDPFIS